MIGLALLIFGGLVIQKTPANVTWGNHHYLKHLVGYGALAVGAFFVYFGTRRA